MGKRIVLFLMIISLILLIISGCDVISTTTTTVDGTTTTSTTTSTTTTSTTTTSTTTTSTTTTSTTTTSTTTTSTTTTSTTSTTIAVSLTSVTDLTIDSIIDTGNTGVIVNNGNYFYYTGWNPVANNLGVIDFTNPEDPTIDGTYAGGVGNGYGIATDGRYVYVETEGGGTDPVFSGEVISFDFQDHSNITLLDHTDDGYYSAYQIYYYKGYVYNVSSNIISIFDVANPSDLDYITEISTFNAYWANFQDDFIYFADELDFKVYDVSDPTDPKNDGTFSITCYSSAVSGNYAFVGGDSGLITALNITDHSNISSAGTLILSDTTSHIDGEMKIHGNFLFISDDSNFWVVDIANPASMTEIAQVTLSNDKGWGFALSADSNYALVADDTDIKVVKIIH